MNYYNLDEFSKEIELLEVFFTEFAAREDEVLTLGMRRVARWESYKKAAQYMRVFETRIHEFHEFLRPIDRVLFERVKAITAESGLVDAVIGIEVALRIAAQRQRMPFGGEFANTLLFQLPYITNFIRRRRIFSEEIIPIQKLLVALGRLKNFVAMAGDSYVHRWSHDSDVFKPSNLDNEKIILLIEGAIDSIENGSYLSRDDKGQLIEYLYKAKSEFSEDRPSWNKIVGALVIAAAIISGVADSSGAFENIDKAIKYILGNSVEKHIPTPVPLLRTQGAETEEADAEGLIRV